MAEPQSTPAEALVNMVRERVDELKFLIARGKVEWPNGNTISDRIWNGWLAEKAALELLLTRSGNSVE